MASLSVHVCILEGIKTMQKYASKFTKSEMILQIYFYPVLF